MLRIYPAATNILSLFRRTTFAIPSLQFVPLLSLYSVEFLLFLLFFESHHIPSPNLDMKTMEVHEGTLKATEVH